jgi:WD40 repeat protein
MSIAWHPTKSLLATAGDGNIPRVWDVETGECLTKRVFWHTGSPAEMLVWSTDGELFLSGIDVVDARTSEYVCDSGLQYYFRFSAVAYNKLRGHDTSFRGSAYASTTHNFTPWRPHRNQIVFENYEKNLVLRDGRTGEIVQVIDCDVDSQIVDFAWHPKGRFIAVAFEEHNIRIIDLDTLKIIDDLSVRRLAGWSPDGKMLVARKEEPRDEFVCWHALKLKEQPLPDYMKNQLWFKRFSANISADGLRFIQSEHDDHYTWTTGIYSVSSGEVLATLPGHITAAAWSLVDGRVLATCEGDETSIWTL